MTSSSESGQKQLGTRPGPSPWSVAYHAIPIEAGSRETMRITLLKQRREGEID